MAPSCWPQRMLTWGVSLYLRNLWLPDIYVYTPPLDVFLAPPSTTLRDDRQFTPLFRHSRPDEYQHIYNIKLFKAEQRSELANWLGE